jgi:Protein of unknown function (DUF2384)
MQIARGAAADVRAQAGHHAPRQTGLATIAPRDVGAVATRSDAAFLALLAAYRDSGGLAHADEVVTLLERRRGLDAHRLARWRSERRVVAFGWQSHAWLPRFQFERPGLLPDPGVSAVLAVLGTVFDDWQSAWWFARPHPALDDRTPAQAIARDLAAVLITARGDRLVARG